MFFVTGGLLVVWWVTGMWQFLLVLAGIAFFSHAFARGLSGD
jgi:hypothetical protein